MVKLELWADDNHGTTRIIHTLTQQVAAETTFLTLEHIAQRLELASSTTRQGFAPLRIINQRINCFLQHAFLVADDYIRCTQLKPTLEAVVAVDDTPVKGVQIGCGKTPTIQLDH